LELRDRNFYSLPAQTLFWSYFPDEISRVISSHPPECFPSFLYLYQSVSLSISLSSALVQSTLMEYFPQQLFHLRYNAIEFCTAVYDNDVKFSPLLRHVCFESIFIIYSCIYHVYCRFLYTHKHYNYYIIDNETIFIDFQAIKKNS